MKTLLFVTTVIALALPLVAEARPAKHPHPPRRLEQVRPVQSPLNDTRGNAALGGNNANSMSGPNSAGENAEGRTSGGGFGG